MKDVTLVVMAAGIGSRFGGGIKQLEPMGPNGEIIMDYSIHDAIQAGFTKVVSRDKKVEDIVEEPEDNDEFEISEIYEEENPDFSVLPASIGELRHDVLQVG